MTGQCSRGDQISLHCYSNMLPECTKTETKPCRVKLHGRSHVIIPEGHKLCVGEGARVGKENPNTSFILEPPSLLLCLLVCFLKVHLNITCKASGKIPVIFRNTADHSITLSPKLFIGEISVAQRALSAMQSVVTSPGTPNEKLSMLMIHQCLRTRSNESQTG